MANVSVKRIEILLHRDRRGEVLKRLADAGTVELETQDAAGHPRYSTPDSGPGRRARRLRDDIRRALDYLDRFAPKGGFIAGMMGHKVASESPGPPEDFDAVEAAGRVIAKAEREAELLGRRQRLEDDLTELRRWAGLPLAPTELGSTASCRLAAYSLPSRNLAGLRGELAEAAGELCRLEEVGGDAVEAKLLIVWHRAVDESVEEALKTFELGACPLNDDRPPAARLDEIEDEIAAVEAELEELKSSARELLELRDPLYLALDGAATTSLGEELVAGSLAAGEAIYLLGWVPEPVIERVRGALDELELAHYELREPTEEETPPVYLKNGSPVRPFEMVTDLYGRPDPREYDPTPLFAFFFALYFGICITDAGYGLLLMLSSWFFLKRLPLGQTTRKMFRLLTIAGGFTVVVGLLTGGIFGLDFSALHLPTLEALRRKIMIIDPLDPDQMFYFFYFSLGLGYLQLFIGYLLGFFNALRVGDSQTAWFRKLPWILVMILIPLAVGLPALAGIDGAWAWYAAAAVGLFVVAFSGVGDDSGLPRLGAGFFNLYTGISGLFSDVLSYARLFALGLATAVIAQVVNTMAFGGGVVGTVLILVIGHVFNLAMNALSGFIHTARLQFVEYFDKFYFGGGRTFQPYAHSLQHTVLKR